jgi:hypothetical protein
MPADRDLFGPQPASPGEPEAGKRRRATGKGGGKARRARKGEGREVVRGKVKVYDPFELVRWLAMSQPDPRKALAELVQNSLDAGAHRVRVTRVRRKGVPCLEILDDGEGVIPELERTEALRYIATHIGHSRKRSLSPQERLQLMTQGQYGIGLLGFWSLGEALEIRTGIPGQRPHRLVLYRDSPEYRIEPIRARDLFSASQPWTEVVIVDLHREAMPVLVARRAADYLAAELRGQLFSRRVDLVVEDKMARGRAEKIVPVRPRRFLGERLAELDRLEVPGRPPARLEIYLVAPDEVEADPLALYGAGTLVAESFRELAALGLDRAPFTDPRLSGLVDFPAFTVAPGSRRGVVPNEAAAAFARALRSVEPVIRAALERLEQRRAEELDRKLVKDLQRAFRGFFRQQPRYALLPVAADGRGEGPQSADGVPGETAGAAAPAIDGEAPGPGVTIEEEPSREEELPPVPPELPFPPGPLAAVEIHPSPVRLSLGGARRARARAVDERGRAAQGPVTFHWRLEGAAASLEAVDGEPEVLVRAGEEAATATLSVVARSWDGREEAAAASVIVEEEGGRGRSDEGIPEPELVEHPGARWRSRVVEGRWQVNSAHTEFRAIRASPTLKLRYLAMLFAKEVVLRSTQDPRLDQPLEQLVEIAAYADRNFAGRGRKRREKS